jgi:hypothetical protein
MKRRSAGFTAVEAAMSSALLSMLVIAATGVCRMTMQATSTVAIVDSADGQGKHAVDRLRQLLLPVSLATLQGIPSSGGKVAEAMQPKVDYADLRFRQVAGFEKGARTFTPPADQPEWRLYRVADQRGNGGELWLERGGSSCLLLDDVERASFQLDGKRLTIVLTFLQGSQHQESASYQLDLTVMAP